MPLIDASMSATVILSPGMKERLGVSSSVIVTTPEVRCADVATQGNRIASFPVVIDPNRVESPFRVCQVPSSFIRPFLDNATSPG